ncbi:MAG TPA: hypothetical protein VFR73_04140 [Hyphomicrobiaceae bacterium]|nr:hypothetical protein [Hyphomicrobiaceae bacterium]
MSAGGKRGSAVAVAQSLQRKPVGELERIAFANAHDERMLWAVLGALQNHRGQGADHLKRQIRERLILKKPLPAPLPQSAVWTRATPRPRRRRRWYGTVAYVLIVAFLIAGARVTNADARLVELVMDGVRSLSTYLNG